MNLLDSRKEKGQNIYLMEFSGSEILGLQTFGAPSLCSNGYPEVE
jgi:hypothetical protein